MTARQHQALYRRWRAQTFGEIVGQEAVVATLRNAVRLDQVSHALLFVGPRGTGKTSMARIVAKALNCTNLLDGEPDDACMACVAIREGRALDVLELDAASNNKVDDMRDLLRGVATAPSDMRRKVYVVDEVQRIKEGWDVLLKTLEEPPDHVTFIFCTTDASQVRPAVLSRVQRFDFRPLTVLQIKGKLSMVLEAEGRTAEPEAIDLVARLAAGGMRDAESMLDQLLTAGRDPLTAEQVRELLGIVEAETVDAFVAALAAGDALAGVRILDALEGRGRDLRGFLGQVVDALRAALVQSFSSRAGPAHDARALAVAAHRLAEIDPTRSGAGGLRFQLELALLGPLLAGQPASAAPPSAPVPRAATPVPVAAAVSQAAPSKAPAPAPTEQSPATPAALVDKRPPPAPKPAAAPTGAAEHPASDPPRELTPRAAIGPELEGLLRRWPEVVTYVSKANGAARPLIEECRPIAIEGNVVTLGFPESKGFLRDVAERRRKLLEESLAHFVGREVGVRLVATNLDLRLPPDQDADRLLAEARRIFAEEMVDVGEVT